MTTTFLVWKDEKCNGENIEWVTMTGKQFSGFIRKPENQHRRFIRLNNSVCEDADVIVIEATEKQYAEWREQYEHEKYLRKNAEGRETVSLNYKPDDTHPLLEIIADSSVDVEESAIYMMGLKSMRNAIKMLDEKDMAILDLLFFDNSDCVSERNLAKEYGIPQKTLNNRKTAVIKKIRKIMAQNRKNSPTRK